MPLYYRPEVQVDAMYVESEDVYLVNGLREQQVKLSREEFELDYIKIDGRSRRRRSRKRTAYRSSNEAPRLTTPNELPLVPQSRLLQNDPPEEEQLLLLNGATVPKTEPPQEPPTVEAPEEG